MVDQQLGSSGGTDSVGKLTKGFHVVPSDSHYVVAARLFRGVLDSVRRCSPVAVESTAWHLTIRVVWQSEVLANDSRKFRGETILAES